MSYIRAGSPLIYVEGNSTDYIFHSVGNEEKPEGWIEDYGSISNESIVEILANRFLKEDPTFRDYLIPILAERLNVKLREKPLSYEELDSLYDTQMAEWRKNNDERL